MSRAKKNQLIEFKGNTLSAIVVTLRSLHPEELTLAAEELFGEDSFFDGDAALLDLGQCGDSAGVDRPDWAALVGVFKPRGLHVIGVRGANDALRESAMTAGLPDFTAVERAVRSQTELAAQPPSELSQAEVAAASASIPVSTTAISEQSAPVLPAIVPTLIVDHPLRSGQQVYARGGDLVVLAAVSSGAEVIADGSIHIYAPLRGRALAGASGALNARIFTTRFEAELVSIAGIYRTFEEGFPDSLAGQPVQIQLSRRAGDDTSKLAIVSLKTN